LALDHDPGKTTQAIQDRILTNLENLIQLARQQQAQAQARQGKGQRPQQGQQPKPDSGVKADNQGKQQGQPNPNRGQNPPRRSARAEPAITRPIPPKTSWKRLPSGAA